MLVLVFGVLLLGIAAVSAFRLARVPADKPLPLLPRLSDMIALPPHVRRAVTPPEVRQMDGPMAIVIISLAGFGCIVVGVMQLAHLFPMFP